MGRVFAVVVLGLALAAGAWGGGESPERTPTDGRAPRGDAEAIAAAIQDVIQAYGSGDADRLIKVYADDFVDLSEGAPTLVGRAAREVAAARLGDTFSRYV